MSKSIYEQYNLDRESLPPEFTAPGAKIRVSLDGTVKSYRSKQNEITFLEPHDLPVRRVIEVTSNGETTYWTEDLDPGHRFDSKSHWVNLGTGIKPDKPGIRSFLYHLATGYLSGYPITDVLYYALRFGLRPRLGQRILEQEEARRELGAEVFSYQDKAKAVNPLYDGRDT